MLVRILLPHLAANFRRALLVEWLVDEGQAASFGDAICRVNVSDRVLIRGTRWASSLVAHSRRTESPVVAYEEESGRFEATYELVAAEPAVITQQHVKVGEVLEIGALLGIATTGSDPTQNETGSPIDSLGSMRLIARLFESEVGDDR